jgi:hypothetical protein
MRFAILFALPLLVSQTPETKLDGEWRCVGLIVDGEKQPRSLYSKIYLTVEGDSWLEEANGKEMQKARFKARNGVIRFATKDAEWEGRYEVTEGKVRVCWPANVKTGMEPRQGNIVAEWRRVD